MKFSIGQRLFVAVLLAITAVSAAGLAVMRANVLHSFSTYAAKIELDRLQGLTDALQAQYGAHAGWSFLPDAYAGRTAWVREELERLSDRKLMAAALQMQRAQSLQQLQQAQARIRAAEQQIRSTEAEETALLGRVSGGDTGTDALRDAQEKLRIAREQRFSAKNQVLEAKEDVLTAREQLQEVERMQPGAFAAAQSGSLDAAAAALAAARASGALDAAGRTKAGRQPAQTPLPPLPPLTVTPASPAAPALPATPRAPASAPAALPPVDAPAMATVRHRAERAGGDAAGAPLPQADPPLAGGARDAGRGPLRHAPAGSPAATSWANWRATSTAGRQARHAEQSRRQWVADTSHELRTPLSVLRAQLEAIRTACAAPVPRPSRDAAPGAVAEQTDRRAVRAGARRRRRPRLQRERLDLWQLAGEAGPAFAGQVRGRRQRTGARPRRAAAHAGRPGPAAPGAATCSRTACATPAPAAASTLRAAMNGALLLHVSTTAPPACPMEALARLAEALLPRGRLAQPRTWRRRPRPGPVPAHARGAGRQPGFAHARRWAACA
jgi:two-component system sensor histidine kinase BaeS